LQWQHVAKTDHSVYGQIKRKAAVIASIADGWLILTDVSLVSQ